MNFTPALCETNVLVCLYVDRKRNGVRKGMSDEIFRRDSPGGVTDPCFLADEKFGKRVRSRDGGEEPGGFSMHDLQCKESDPCGGRPLFYTRYCPPVDNFLKILSCFSQWECFVHGSSVRNCFGRSWICQSTNFSFSLAYSAITNN